VCNRNHTATGNHIPYGITQCYLPSGNGDFPAFTPAEAGTRFSNPGGMLGRVDMGEGYIPRQFTQKMCTVTRLRNNRAVSRKLMSRKCLEILDM